MPCGAEVGEMNWAQCSKGWTRVRYELRPPKRNERREWTDRKYMEIKHDIFFPTATAEREEGKSWGLRAAQRAKRWFCAAIIHNLVMGFLIDLAICQRNDHNYMLCIIALSCFFSGASAARWWRLECKRLFCLFCKKCDRKKTTKRGLCGSRQKDCASPEVRRAGIFGGWGLTCGAARNYLTGLPDRLGNKTPTINNIFPKICELID